jgi:RNA polymerase sigma-70 factor (ECF subfamily)
MVDARQAAERVARVSYGRLLARLAARTRDIAAAEDALAEAFRTALQVWPERGVPERPEAWLTTVARRAFGHVARHHGVQDAAAADLRLLAEEAADPAVTDFPDERLKLLFVCAHSAIDPASRTPLMLQTVLGLDATRIAGAFITSPAAMAQRLVRAKAKIRDAGIGFQEPEHDELPERLSAVLAAIYAAYGAGWEEGIGTGLTEEAIFLGRLLVQLLPSEPEARGLLALMLYCQSRAGARRTADGLYVPLAEQDPQLWSRDLIIEAEGQLTTASRAGVFGRYQTEAAIQSVHAHRAVSGTLNHQALLTLYDLLALHAPSIGVLVARAAVHGEVARSGGRPGAARHHPARARRAYQPFWAVKATLLAQDGQTLRSPEQRDRIDRRPEVRAYLLAKLGG